MREQIIFHSINSLEKKGFLVSTYLHSNNCFDIAAKKDNLLFFIKVFENIDATRPQQALELKKLSTALNATPLIIGKKTKTLQLSDSTVYDRYGITCVTINSFKAFLEQNYPKTLSFKGKNLVELDSQRLREKRQSKGLTLSELAKKIDSTPKSIHEYEKGQHSSIEVAKKLEKILSVPLIKQIDLSQKKPEENIFEKGIQDPIFKKITKLGLELALFEHAPFEAFSHPKESLLISKAQDTREAKRKGLKLAEAKKIIDADSVIIAKKFNKKSTSDFAVIEVEELESFSKKKDFLETIKEREKNERGVFSRKKRATS